ncbi:MAG: endolytic transglycosylase MltG [Spirochaetes bacterium]|nr:endolytic transglycosylase MltG [Spirochaetota bacterium]
MRRPATILARAGAIALGALACLAAIAAWLNASPAPRAPGDRLFLIRKGESLSRISERLQEERYIRFAPLLDLLGRLRGTAGSFKAGYYRIPPRASTTAVHDLLVSGAQSLGKVTIPEGWTVSKIAAHLEAEGVCPAADFVQAALSAELARRLGAPTASLEGYLFPDTYFVPAPFPAETLVEIMVKRFFETLEDVAPGWKEMAPAALQEKLTVASIVEREYRLADEAPRIASVFYNRLRGNIGLESCATLEYIITEIQGKAHPEYITIEDKKIDSPYNTYRWAGLPPGPISNPGRIALEAAFQPARTDFLYFVLQDAQTGRHHFSRDLSEHNQAKFLYLKKP